MRGERPASPSTTTQARGREGECIVLETSRFIRERMSIKRDGDTAAIAIISIERRLPQQWPAAAVVKIFSKASFMFSSMTFCHNCICLSPLVQAAHLNMSNTHSTISVTDLWFKISPAPPIALFSSFFEYRKMVGANQGSKLP